VLTTKSGPPIKFTAERRERFLTLLETGRNIEEACADVGVSRATVTKWAAKGRRPGATDDSVEFAFRLDEIRDGQRDANLNDDDLVRLLEKQARKGSVRAIQLLLERPWEKKSADTDGPDTEQEQDPFAALEGDQLAQRRAKRRTA
jgi:transposase